MESASLLVSDFISAHHLPDDPQSFLEEFCSADKKYLDLQEGTLWDYKKEFPFSRSDGYFGGIVRLICAFHNTFGGLIIFGVEDTTREIVSNPVRIDIEPLNAVFRERLTSPIECSVRHYDLSDSQSLDILLIPKRAPGCVPVRFSVPIDKYQPGLIYIRKNHEVLASKSIDMPFLYGPRYRLESYENRDIPTDVIQSLPASPATVKEFIGRFEVMDRLWNWLVDDDDPRTFLFGKGGSGKSTIAFEFAKMVALNASYFKTKNDEHFDCVIFLSAKKRSFDTNTSQIVPFIGSDFETSEELFRQIILLSEWRNSDDVESMSLDTLRKDIKELMDTITPLIVIDDIDTLTTLGRDPGMDALYQAAIRAKKGAKVLYTLRNAPTHSLAQAIEVPGLQDTEYRDFIRACCEQFKQAKPSDAIIDGPLSDCSERRPLVIEAVIGLRRTAGSYEGALALLQQRAGDEVRSYLFEREYNALSTDNKARYILAALSLSSKPLRSADLEVVTRFDRQQLSDALGEIREMFLTLAHDDNGETQYTLGQSTRDYIATQREHLDQFANLKERIRNYTSPFSRRNPDLTLLLEQVRKALFYYKDPQQALKLLENKHDNPKISQHLLYQSWLGIVAARHAPPLLDKARESFKFAQDLGRLDPDALRAWYYLEWTSGTGTDTAIHICDTVLDDESYSDVLRAEFCSKKGYALQLKSRHLGDADPEGTIRFLAKSLDYNIKAYNLYLDLSETDIEKQSAWTSSCASQFLNECIRYDEIKVFFDTINKYAKQNIICDPLANAISQVCHWSSRRTSLSSLDRVTGFLYQFKKLFQNSQRTFVFIDVALRKDIVSTLERAIEKSRPLREQIKSRKSMI